jgi:hypothetical protein
MMGTLFGRGAEIAAGEQGTSPITLERLIGFHLAQG